MHPIDQKVAVQGLVGGPLAEEQNGGVVVVPMGDGVAGTGSGPPVAFSHTIEELRTQRSGLASVRATESPISGVMSLGSTISIAPKFHFKDS